MRAGSWRWPPLRWLRRGSTAGRSRLHCRATPRRSSSASAVSETAGPLPAELLLAQAAVHRATRGADADPGGPAGAAGDVGARLPASDGRVEAGVVVAAAAGRLD